MTEARAHDQHLPPPLADGGVPVPRPYDNAPPLSPQGHYGDPQGPHPTGHVQYMEPPVKRISAWTWVALAVNVATLVIFMSWFFWPLVLILTVIGRVRGTRRIFPWVLFAVSLLAGLAESLFLLLIAMPPGAGNPIPFLN